MRGGRGGASEVLEVCEGVRCFSVCVARGCVEFLAAITVGAASAASTVFFSRQKIRRFLELLSRRRFIFSGGDERILQNIRLIDSDWQKSASSENFR